MSGESAGQSPALGDSSPAATVDESGPKHLAGIGHGPLASAAICVDGMSFSYRNGDAVLTNINLHVARGGTLVLIGPNGGGKTTLLKILLGLLQGYTGSVQVEGMPPREARSRGDVIGWVPQRTGLNWDFPASLRDVVQMGLTGRTGLFGRPSNKDREYVERVLAALEIDRLADRPIGDLSGGQQQRAIIARSLVPHPRVLMLDEPTVGVDASGKQRLVEILETVKREFGITLVLVSHDLRMAISSSPRVACLNRSLHFHDAPERLTQSMLEHVYDCNLDGLLPAACHHGALHEAE